MMSTWSRGRTLLRESLRRDGIELQPFIDSLGNEGLQRVARSAVFLMAEPGTVPNALLHNFKHNPVVHGRNALVTVVFHEVPWIGADRRAVVQSLGHGIGASSFPSASWTCPTCRRLFGHSWRRHPFGDPHDERSAQRRASSVVHALRHPEAARHRQPHHPGKPGQSHSLAPGERVNSFMALPIGLKDGEPRFALGLPGGLRIFR